MEKKKHPGGRPTRYLKRYAAEAAKLCTLGATDQDLANFFGVVIATIHNWKNSHPEFLDAIKESKEAADAKVERALYEMATGYKYKTEKPLIVSDGKELGSHVEITEYTESIPPNTTAQIFWLKNRKPGDWRDKREIEVSEIKVGLPPGLDDAEFPE